jgi:preprotein translocase subunit SecE
MAKTLAVTDTPTTGMDRLKTAPARLIDFLKDVRAEMKKVITPSRAQVQSTTIVVIATVFTFAVFFAIVDFFVGHAVTYIFDHLAKT